MSQEAKKFQKATSDYIVSQLKTRQRFLLADEVGLGKTIVAKTVLETMAAEKKDKDIFTVLYVCSNSALAEQNCRKFGISAPEDANECRLSMLHLKIQEIKQEIAKNTKNQQICLIPMTTNTSFKLRGIGSAQERAFAAVVLAAYLNKDNSENIDSDLENEIAYLLKGRRCQNWKDDTNETGYYYTQKKRVKAVSQSEQRRIYEEDLYNHMAEYMKKEDPNLQDAIKELLGEMTSMCQAQDDKCTLYDWWDANDTVWKNERKDWLAAWKSVVNRVRKMFAAFTLQIFHPDLIIMDEFQRFEELLETGEAQSEAAAVFQKFGKYTKMLLLSATPYNLRTWEPAADQKFKNMVASLMSETEYNAFEETWDNYVLKMREFEEKPTERETYVCLLQAKEAVEKKLYSCMCRTERRSEQMIDASKAKNIMGVMTEQDIRTYVELRQFVEKEDFQTAAEAAAQENNISRYDPRTDYVKSTPFLLSFMVSESDYTFKRVFEGALSRNEELKKSVAGELPDLFLKSESIKNYKALPACNARLKTLWNEVFGDAEQRPGAECLLWIPPSNPYYQCNNSVFETCAGYSKTLVFSKWQMIPRAISTLTSYEAERRARLADTKTGQYYENRTDHLLDKTAKELAAYPSEWLAGIYGTEKQKEMYRRPAETLKKAIIKDIKADIRDYGKKEFEEMVQTTYSLEKILEFLKKMDEKVQGMKLSSGENVDSKRETSESRSLFDGKEEILEILVNIAIASPAVCLYRVCRGLSPEMDHTKRKRLVKSTSKSFVSMFNKPEVKQIMAAVYPDEKPTHYAKVFQYCVDGNMQAMLDEYRFASGVSCAEEFLTLLESSMLQTATLDYVPVEAYQNSKHAEAKESSKLRMHFAVGYFDIKNSENQSMMRAKNVRNAFNSPFWPFVLTTTSVGQEGLDFHLYCRKVVHWNLPAVPIDFEQREGRVNRYLCHAIRQNVAMESPFGWEEKFEAAKKACKDDQSELTPYWCLPESYLENLEKVYKIERIVPMYPFSQDEIQYERIRDVLAFYRLTLGQPDPEALAFKLKKTKLEEKDKETLIFNLSPYSKKQKEREGEKTI